MLKYKKLNLKWRVLQLSSFLFSSSDKRDSSIRPWLSQMRNINIRYVSWVWFYVLEAVNIFSHREVIWPSPTLMCLCFNPLLGLLIHWGRFDLSVMSSFPSVSAGLNTYLISGRKFEPHSCCGCSQLGSAGHELAEQCVASRAHTPDGASSVCSLPPDGVKVQVHGGPWGSDEASTMMWWKKMYSAFMFHCVSPLTEEEHWIAFSALWFSSLLLSACCCLRGCIKSFLLEWRKEIVIPGFSSLSLTYIWFHLFL